jgi:hypothetical protein
VIDIISEQLIPLAAACDFVPPARRGRRTALSTMLRWIMRGVRNHADQVVRLEAVRIGSRWMTTREALQRFAERLTPAADAPVPAPPTRTPERRQRASERAAAELERFGL